jgi:hypothetical protein
MEEFMFPIQGWSGDFGNQLVGKIYNKAILTLSYQGASQDSKDAIGKLPIVIGTTETLPSGLVHYPAFRVWDLAPTDAWSSTPRITRSFAGCEGLLILTLGEEFSDEAHRWQPGVHLFGLTVLDENGFKHGTVVSVNINDMIDGAKRR